MLEIFVNKQENLENIIIAQNGKIIENYTSTEEDKKRRIEGNIYIGEVSDIVNGMGAAFVDYGMGRKGLLHLKDAMPQIDETKEKFDDTIKISEVLNPKQKILVQIKKDSDEKKGAKVSTHISLPGRYVVLMPNTTFITVSQKIENKEQKSKLINLIKKHLPKGFGAVIRTACEKAKEEDLKYEIDYLLGIWAQIQKNVQTNPNKVRLVWESENIVEKIITDLSENKIDQISVNSVEEYNKLQKKYKDLKIIFEKEKDLLKKYDLDKQLEKMLERKIWLNCGGFITIDKTEALTAIDVNTGKFTGKKNLEETVFKVNKEASIEIAKQLRLRDIGGIIIIDYIDMKNEENKQKIVDILKNELKKDRAKTQVEGFTKLNLMELTRKHICSHLNG